MAPSARNWERARVFDMRVWGITRSGKGDASFVEKILPASQLHEALSERITCDCGAETAETKHLIGAAEILSSAQRRPTLRGRQLNVRFSSGDQCRLSTMSRATLMKTSPAFSLREILGGADQKFVSASLWRRNHNVIRFRKRLM